MNPDNISLLQSAFAIAGKTKARAIFLYIDPLEDLIYPKPIPRSPVLILFSKKKKRDFSPEEKRSLAGRAKALFTLPKLPLTRTSMMKLSLMLAMASERIPADGLIVLITGQAEFGRLDCVQLIDPKKETELITMKGSNNLVASINPEVFQAVLNLSIELAEKGREGKPVGTIFVVGDTDKVMQLSKQMIMNPFKGYEEEERNIVAHGLKETIREFAALDGAFVIGADGTVVTAGRYLGVGADGTNLPRGLGSRHIAAAGITALTDCVAFVISESSGDVRIFKDGKVLMEIEKS